MARATARGEECGIRMVRGDEAWEVRVKLRVGGQGLEKW